MLAALACAPGAAGADVPTPTVSYGDYLSARYAQRAGDPVEAAARLGATARREPKNVALAEDAAAAALEAGDHVAASEFGRTAYLSGSVAGAGLLAYAAQSMREGRYTDAYKGLARADGDVLDIYSVRILRAWSKIGSGAKGQAMRELGAEGGAPDSGWDALALYERALLLQAQGDPKAADTFAAADASRGFRFAPFVIEYSRTLAQGGDRSAAEALLTGFLADSDNPGADAELAKLRSGAPVSVETNPARLASVSIYGLAAAIGPEGSTQEYRRLLGLALALNPQSDGVRISMAEALRAKDRPDAAIEAARKVPVQSPYWEMAQTTIAWSLKDRGAKDEAVRVLRASVAARQSRYAKRILADYLRLEERYAEAEPIYTDLVASAGPAIKDWRLLFSLGSSLERTGRWKDAEAALHKALEISPDQPEVLNYLGYTWVDRGERVAEGLELIERAVGRRPTSGYIVDSLGWAHYRLGNYGQAVEYLERAVEMAPSDPTLVDHLGDAYWRVGRRAEARNQWRRIASLESDPAEREAAQKKLLSGLPETKP